MSLIFGIATLPTRRSPMKIAAGGFALGVGLSYFFWRLQLNRYDGRVNQVFKNIVREQYI